MARYSTPPEIKGYSAAIQWKTREFNLGITYNNGIIAITEPGYYRIIANCYCIDKHPAWIGFRTNVNGSRYLDTNTTWSSPGFMHGIIYLDVFDTIYFSANNYGGAKGFQGGKNKNYFTIEKL